MANNYLQFSERILTTPAQSEWLKAAWDAVGDNEADPKFVAIVDELFGDNDTNLCVLSVRPEHVWLYSEESCDLDSVAELLQRFMKEFDIKDPICIHYAEWCSKLLVREFGGGVVVITPQKFVLWGTATLEEFARKEVERVEDHSG